MEVDQQLQATCRLARVLAVSLISVPAAEADALVDAARQRGAPTTCVIGEVRERSEAALIVLSRVGSRALWPLA